MDKNDKNILRIVPLITSLLVYEGLPYLICIEEKLRLQSYHVTISNAVGI